MIQYAYHGIAHLLLASLLRGIENSILARGVFHEQLNQQCLGLLTVGSFAGERSGAVEIN
jgi:hypothetical protein